MALLVGRRGGELDHAHVARIHLGHQPLDRPALARRVPALEHHAHRRPELALADLTAERQAQLRRAAPRRGRAPAPPPCESATAERSSSSRRPTAAILSPSVRSRARCGPGGSGLSLNTLSASGNAAAARKTRMIPSATSHRERLRWPRTPIAKPIDHQGHVGTDGLAGGSLQPASPPLSSAGCPRHHSPAPSPRSRRRWGGSDTWPTSPRRWSPTWRSGSASPCWSRDRRGWERPSWRRRSRGRPSAR